MSLDVSPEIILEAEQGKVSEESFTKVIKQSFPKAWAIVESLVSSQKERKEVLVSCGSGPLDDESRGQLLRMCAGNAIKAAVERHFRVHLLFQNCHNVAVVKEGEKESADAKTFTSPKSQVKNQKPQYQHC